MKKYKAILFDFDGTIADTNEIILKSWRYIYMHYLGRECRDEEVVDSFGEVLIDTLIERFPNEDPEEMLDLFRNYQKSFFEEEIEIFPGMTELIVELEKRGYKLAIVTSRTKSQALVGLKKFDLLSKFDVFVSCEDTTAHKPDPAPTLIALKKLGVKANEAIFVGDSKNDIKCAHNAGVAAVLVDWTICLPEKERFGENRAEYVITAPEQLLDIV